MNHELEALLVVQQDDAVIRDVQSRRDAIAPRLLALDQARKRAAEEVSRNAMALERESARHRALELQIAEHRDRHEKHLDVLNHAHKLREATAAMAQVETAKKVLVTEESELLALSRRLTDLRTASTAATEQLARLDQEQTEIRATIIQEQSTLAQELADAQAQRALSAANVGKTLLSQYDRVHARRQSDAVFALQPGFSCSSCDTAIPLQRRPKISGGQTIEVCEGCGVLVYMPVKDATV